MEKREGGKATEFVERMKRVQEEVGAALKKAQKEIKRYADKKKKKRQRTGKIETE